MLRHGAAAAAAQPLPRQLATADAQARSCIVARDAVIAEPI